jgi:hypothetical protein
MINKLKSTMDFINNMSIKGQQILDDTRSFLVNRYNQVNKVFNYSTSFGQVLLVIMNIFKVMMYYLQDVASEKNLSQAKRTHNIYGMARLAGHNPARNRSGIADVSIFFNPSASLDEIIGNNIYIPNHTKLRCLQNNLIYTMNLKSDFLLLDKTSQETVTIRIIEGEYESQSYTGSGEDLQSINVTVQNNQQIENDNIHVSVNGTNYDIYESLYDIPYKAYGCVVKTGINSGLDVYFGNSINAQVPPLGSTITVDYIISNGASGNITDKEFISFIFESTGFDINAGEVDLNAYLKVITETPILMGANAEPPGLTRIIAPMTNKNRVIHDSVSIEYEMLRLNQFSSVTINTESSGIINEYEIIPIPRIADRLNVGDDYFSVDIAQFSLNDDEITRLLNYIEESGRKSANIDIKIKSPVIKRYVMYVVVEAPKTKNGRLIRESDLRGSIRTALSEFLINNNRNHKIGLSDVISVIDGVDDVDTTNVTFISEDNENLYINNTANGIPHTDIGFDTIGNVKVGVNEYAVIRGGFTDRDGVYYEDSFNTSNNTMGSVNLIITLV